MYTMYFVYYIYINDVSPFNLLTDSTYVQSVRAFNVLTRLVKLVIMQIRYILVHVTKRASVNKPHHYYHHKNKHHSYLLSMKTYIHIHTTPKFYILIPHTTSNSHSDFTKTIYIYQET